MDLSQANSALVEAFADGETVTVTVGETSFEIEAAFRSPWTGETVAGLAVERPAPELLVAAAVWAATGASNGDRVTARGADHLVMDVQPDVDGGVVVTLSGAPA